MVQKESSLQISLPLAGEVGCLYYRPSWVDIFLRPQYQLVHSDTIGQIVNPSDIKVCFSLFVGGDTGQPLFGGKKRVALEAGK